MRLFLAIEPGDACRQRLASVIGLLRSTTNGVRWVREAKLHVTLAFLGEVDELRVSDLRDAAKQLALRHRVFSAAVEGSGVFPDWRRPRVVWLGIRGPQDLQDLGDDIGAMCQAQGFPLDHPFRAHVTIGRVSRPLSGAHRDALRRSLSSLSGTYPFDVTRVVLLRSTMGADGSEYAEVASFPLGHP